MILIADSGSTKCDWVLLDINNEIIDRIKTKGLNPAVLKTKDIVKIIRKNNHLYQYKNKVQKVYFFGAGCNTKKAKRKISKILVSEFPNNLKIKVYEDLMLAVLAATTEPALVCILGTGSNCCFFDGQKLHQKHTAMGYLIMDEGSGNHLGKLLLKAYFYNKIPENLKFSLEKTFNLETKKVISKLYNSKKPNRYLAKFARFLFENKEHPFCQEIINISINKFIANQLNSYKEEIELYPIYFIGSIAYFSQDFIVKNLKAKKINQPTKFIRRPLDNLIKKVKQKNNFL